VLDRIGHDLRAQLPDYRGSLRAAVCLAFDEQAPRRWHGGPNEQGRGGWVLEIDWLKAWLDGRELQDGLGVEELRRLDAAAGPRWDRRVMSRLPAQHNVG
jgi:hypothetical protein